MTYNDILWASIAYWWNKAELENHGHESLEDIFPTTVGISSTRKNACVADALEELRFNFVLMSLIHEIEQHFDPSHLNPECANAGRCDKPKFRQTAWQIIQEYPRNYPELQFKHSLPHGPSGILTTNFSSAIPHQSNQAKVRLWPSPRDREKGSWTHWQLCPRCSIQSSSVLSLEYTTATVFPQWWRNHRQQRARTKKTSLAPTTWQSPSFFPSAGPHSANLG